MADKAKVETAVDNHASHLGNKYLDPDCEKCMEGAETNEEDFTSIGPARWASIKTAVKAKLGIDITTDAGSQKSRGVALAWVYDPEKQTLSITLISRDWFDPSAAAIDNDVKTWVNATALDYKAPVVKEEKVAAKKTEEKPVETKAAE